MRKGLIIIGIILLVLVSSGCIGETQKQETKTMEEQTQPIDKHTGIKITTKFFQDNVNGDIYIDGLYVGSGYYENRAMDEGNYTLSFGNLNRLVTPNSSVINIKHNVIRTITQRYNLAPPYYAWIDVEAVENEKSVIVKGNTNLPDGINISVGIWNVDRGGSRAIIAFASSSATVNNGTYETRLGPFVIMVPKGSYEISASKRIKYSDKFTPTDIETKTKLWFSGN